MDKWISGTSNILMWDDIKILIEQDIKLHETHIIDL